MAFRILPLADVVTSLVFSFMAGLGIVATKAGMADKGGSAASVVV